ncbi:8172_t:CDS:2 [Acaulospora morrowiae]|uniref:8172_t:CDS:1 n=1 Tax=Acaulospora morrowiae TaxID=94023 RepID=A0A9N9AB35_9GLOM|nr:8172_t:CDS:2 [Acaulospora morrowiae]
MSANNAHINHTVNLNMRNTGSNNDNKTRAEDRSDHCDVMIRVGEHPNVKNFYANSRLLSSKCSYFRTALSSNWARKEDDVYIIEKPNISPRVFEIVLGYINNGVINWNALDSQDFLGIWLAAEEFMLDDLERKVQEFFKTKEDLRPKFIQILRLVYQNDSLERFRSNCVDIINTTTWVQDAAEFASLEESIFHSLLNDEEHCVYDGVMWNLLIQWACAQMPRLDTSKRDMWTTRDFETLKSRIDHFIPYIKFSLISRNDFYENVLPYKAILSMESTSNASLQYYLHHIDDDGNPKSDVLRPNVILDDSRIVNHTHVAVIARWIDTGREKENINHSDISASISIPSFDSNSNPILGETSSIETDPEQTVHDTKTKSDEKSSKYSWKPSPLKRLWPLRKHKKNSNNADPAGTKKSNNDNAQDNTHTDSNHSNKDISILPSFQVRTPSIASNQSSNSTYHFKLIYRGSRDSFDNKSYYMNCKGKGATVMVASVSRTRFIVGGYYPISTEGTYPILVFAGSLDAFIFSFGDGDNPEEESVISRVLKEHAHEAICRTLYGPGFGDNDLIIKLAGQDQPKNGICGKKFYERKIVDMSTFNFDEVEVFQVIKNDR